MQRALDASRALAESLATENSALTDSYNQQVIIAHPCGCEFSCLIGEIAFSLIIGVSLITVHMLACLKGCMIMYLEHVQIIYPWSMLLIQLYVLFRAYQSVSVFFLPVYINYDTN